MAISKDKYTKTYKEQEELKGLPGQDKNTATVITPAANFEFKQDSRLGYPYDKVSYD